MNEDLHASEECLAAMKEFEGYREVAYRDDGRGVLTIGYGWTVGVKPGDRTTRAESDRKMRDHVRTVIEPDIYRDVRVRLTPKQFDALVDFEYNLGTSKLDGSTLLRKLNARDYAGAAAEFPRWIHAGDHVLAGLVHRRLVEQSWFKAA